MPATQLAYLLTLKILRGCVKAPENSRWSDRTLQVIKLSESGKLATPEATVCRVTTKIHDKYRCLHLKIRNLQQEMYNTFFKTTQGSMPLSV